MKLKFSFPLFLLFFFIGVDQLIAQEKEEFKRSDVVYLKNGSIFRGQIQFYEVGNELRLLVQPGREIILKAKDIRKIVQEASSTEKIMEDKIVEKAYNFKETGIYYAASLGYIGGNYIFGDYSSGYNAHFQIGYKHRRIIGAGLGVGVDFYNVNLGSIIPVYGEVRGYFKKNNVSPYYRLAGGVGFPITSDTNGFQRNKPGYYLSPAIGIRFGSSSNEKMTLGLGLQWQRATYKQDFGDGVSQIVDKYTFRRFNLRFGVLF